MDFFHRIDAIWRLYSSQFTDQLSLLVQLIACSSDTSLMAKIFA